MIRVLVSSCLLGEPVRYDGTGARAESSILDRWQAEGRMITFCPETAGGLPVPRPPMEIEGRGGPAVLRGEAKVVEGSGRDATRCFVAGANRALEMARAEGARLAVLKNGSPSCGSTYIYDGSFKGVRHPGRGVTAALLEQEGIRVFPFQEIEQAAACLEQLESGERDCSGGGKPRTARDDSTNAPVEIPLIYRDESLVAVCKPSGLAVHRGWANDPRYAMTEVRDRLGRWVYPVHRLDRATSGVLVFALDRETARRLQEQFQDGRVVKRYLALVRGIPPESGVIDHPVKRSLRGVERVPAVTEYRRLGTFERYALVEARPLTGRLHQIRRHFKHLSHPLVGDVRYGKGPINRHFRERFGLHRLALHAREMRLPHPSDGRPLCWLAEIPEDLAGPLRVMELPLP